MTGAQVTCSAQVTPISPKPNYPCKNYWWGRPLLPEILGQSDRAKSPIFDLFSLVAPNKFLSVKTAASDRVVRHSLA